MQKTKLNSNEQGFASIVIALVLIVVLSLLTVGFAQLARREQQSALSRQLATQAYYAAESGINDVIAALPTIRAAGSAVDPDVCLGAPYIPNNKNINNATGVSYSCALVNVRPPVLSWTDVDANASRNLTFTTDGPLDKLTFNWRSETGKTATRPAGGGLAPATDWNSPAVLQVSLTPLRQLTRAALTSNTFTAYLYPSSGGGGSVTYAPTTAQAPLVENSCNSSGVCKATISGIGGAAANEYYLLRFINYYDKSTISVSNARTVADVQLNFVNGQAVVDVTGRAKTVLKRLQVRIPINPDGDGEPGRIVDLPDYTVEAQDLCKRLSVYPAFGEYINTRGSAVSDGSACDLTNP